MRNARWIGLVFCSVLAACGGGTGALVVGGGNPAPTPTPTPNPPAVVQENHVVVRYDLNGDAEPDLVTLDADKTPFEIVAALEGTPNGDAVDMTDLRKGQPIDPAVSEALANYLANSFQVGVETDLDLADENGNPVSVTIFE